MAKQLRKDLKEIKIKIERTISFILNAGTFARIYFLCDFVLLL